MDVEKTIEFLLQQAAAHDARMAAHHEQFMAEIAESRRVQEERWARADRDDERLKRRIDRAIRMSAEEHRRERVRRKQLEAKTAAEDAKLKAAQEDLAQSLKQFLDSMKKGRNGHDKP